MAFPGRIKQVKVNKRFVEAGGKMMVLSNITEGFAVGAHVVTLADHHPVLKNTRKRARSENASTSTMNIVNIVSDKEDDDVFETPWWTEELANKNDGAKPCTMQPGTKRHKSTNN